MTKFHLFGSSSTRTPNQQPLQTLSFQTPTPRNNAIFLSLVGSHGETFPLFSCTKSKKSLQLTRIGTSPSTVIEPTPVGEAKFHTFSDPDLTFMGQSLEMKERDVGSGYKLDHPQFGKLKWDDDKDKDGYVLEDSQEMRIAKFSPGAKKSVIGGVLEVYVPADDRFLDFIVLFTVAMIAESDDFDDELKETAEGLETIANITTVVNTLGGGGS